MLFNKPFPYYTIVAGTSFLEDFTAVSGHSYTAIVITQKQRPKLIPYHEALSQTTLLSLSCIKYGTRSPKSL